MTDDIFVLDTSAMYLYLRGHAGFDDGTCPPVRNALNAIFRKARVFIPRVALVEMMGQFFHMNIAQLQAAQLAQHTYVQYRSWYGRRMNVFQPILRSLFDPQNRVELWEKPTGISSLQFVHDPLTPTLHQRLLDYYKQRREQLRAREPKCLDGVDGQIVFDAVAIATANAPGTCHFVSSDIVLGHVIEDVMHAAVAATETPSMQLQFCSTWNIGALARRLGCL